MTRPMISVSRSSKQYAIFDEMAIVREFRPYEDEQAAIAEAREWIKARTQAEPEIIYPRIDRMTLTYSKRRRR